MNTYLINYFSVSGHKLIRCTVYARWRWSAKVIPELSTALTVNLNVAAWTVNMPCYGSCCLSWIKIVATRIKFSCSVFLKPTDVFLSGDWSLQEMIWTLTRRTRPENKILKFSWNNLLKFVVNYVEDVRLKMQEIVSKNYMKEAISLNAC